MSDPADLEQLVHQAVAGDRHAVAGIVRALERDVYGLALRMLWNREDAEDATQEILVRVVTGSRNSIFGVDSRPGFFGSRPAIVEDRLRAAATAG